MLSTIHSFIINNNSIEHGEKSMEQNQYNKTRLAVTAKKKEMNTMFQATERGMTVELVVFFFFCFVGIDRVKHTKLKTIVNKKNFIT